MKVFIHAIFSGGKPLLLPESPWSEPLGHTNFYIHWFDIWFFFKEVSNWGTNQPQICLAFGICLGTQMMVWNKPDPLGKTKMTVEVKMFKSMLRSMDQIKNLLSI